MSALIWKRVLSDLVDKIPARRPHIRRSRRKRNRRLLLEPLEVRQLLAADFLYIGDAVSDSVQKFNAETGAYIGSFVTSGSAGLHGPRGMVFDQGNLLVVNQNINLPKAGEILRYNGQTGADVGSLVSSSNPNAPFSPAGIVVRDNVVYVADPDEGSSSGRIEKYGATTGEFLGELVPTVFNGEFRPRGLVFGPDDELYVSVSSIDQSTSSDPPGYILSFDLGTGIDRVVAWNDGDLVPEPDQGEAPDLHNPVGLVFAPDGTIYVTSNRTDTMSIDENTRIVVINPAQGNELKTIELDPQTDSAKNPTRLFARAMVFGPEGKLFIPVVVESLGEGPFLSTIVTAISGAIVTYDPSTQQINTFFASSPSEQSIVAPTYAIFGRSSAATLAYETSPILGGMESSPRLVEGPLTAGGGIVYVSTSIEVRDLEGMVSGATVRITGNYHSDQDRLIAGFVNGGHIATNWNASTGTLTLQGRDTVDNYQNALRTISYSNTAASPNLAKRTVSFTVNDSRTNGNTVSRDIVLLKDDLNALFYTTRFAAQQQTLDLLFRLDTTTGGDSNPFIVPGHEEGGLLIVGGRNLLAVGRKSVPIVVEGEEGGLFSGSATRATVLRYPRSSDTSDYEFGTIVVADTSADAPVDPEGILLDGNTLYIADTRSSQPASGPITAGRIRRYDATTGEFLNDITASGYDGLFHPRGIVFGPDGSLYVSLYDPNVDATGAPVNPGYGAILKIDGTSPAPIVIAFNNGDAVQDAGETPDLHGPGSPVFGPGGKLYVTTRATTADGLDKIAVLDPAASFAQVDQIDIARVDDIPLHPRALLFGPDGKLFVSVNEPDNPSPFTYTRGYLRSYNVATKEFTVAASAGPIGYLTFGYTNPKTLAFELPPGAAPVVNAVEGTALAYSADAAAGQVTAMLGVSDSDSSELTGATVYIASNYQPKNDVLSFTNTSKITGVWNRDQGSLTLVGNDTVANYRTALRSVKFQSTTFRPINDSAVSPLPLTRSISFFVSDGAHDSNVATRDIHVTVPRGDYLFIGDQGNPNDPTDDSVKQFDLQTDGTPIGAFVAPGTLIGPRGMVFNRGELLAVNQNVNTPFNGEVLRFEGKTGSTLTPPIVSSNDPQAPFAPRGIVVKDNVLYVADFLGAPSPRIAKYNATTGEFIGDLRPNGFSAPFNPRGLVFGPDGKLYVTVYSADEDVVLSQDPSGYILKFLNTTTGAFEVVASNNGDNDHPAGEIAALHNPEGIVFGPDGRLYVTSFRFNASDNGILVFNASSKQQVGFISLGDSYAQALLFGPDGKLFVPINGGPGAGSVRVYEDAAGSPTFFDIPSGLALQTPWYLTFKQTNPATLAYEPWHNFVNRLDVDGDGHVVPLDALIVINEINTPSVTGALGKLPNSRPFEKFYIDVDQDGFVAPLDALIVINFLNENAQAEGESALPTLRNAAAVAQPPVPALIASAASSSSSHQALTPLPAPSGSTSVAVPCETVAAKTNAELRPRTLKAVKWVPLNSGIPRDLTSSQ